MSRFFPEINTLLVGEVVTSYVNFRSVLLSSETISSSTAAAISGSSDLTVGSTTILAADLVVNGSTLLASKAISFQVSGQSLSAGFNSVGGYHVLAEAVTSGGDTRRGIARFVTARAS